MFPSELRIRTLGCLLLLFGLAQATIAEDEAIEKQCEVKRFEKIIEDGINDALKFVEPKDASSYAAEQCTKKEENLDQSSYDFIIIGSGAAGSVVASRLSEIEGATVLLIEAGHFENDFIDIPGMSAFAPGTEYNWAYKSEPQHGCCLGMVDSRCQFHGGKGIGGTTLINSAVYSRGSAHDYNRWNRTSPGWAFADVLPYFKKSEDAHFTGGDDGYHGGGGLYNVEMSPYTTPHIDAFIAANEELGYKQIDYNGREHLGVSRIQYNTKHGRRVTTGRAFLEPALHRENLRVTVDSYVSRLRFDEDGQDGDDQLRVTGVWFLRNGCEYYVKVKKEVVLSAGTIGSPHILLLSGVGPTEHLESVGVPPLVDLPVGHNLQDHIGIKGLSVQTNTSVDIHPRDADILSYLNGLGPYTLAAVHGAVGFYKTPNHKDPESVDLEFVFTTPNRTSAYFQRFHGFTDETFQGLTANLHSPSTMSAIITLEHPESIGYVQLQSSDPLDYPLINPRFLEDEHGDDIETLYQGILLFQQMLNTEALKRLDAKFLHIELPACKEHQIFSKDYWYCFIRQTSDELFHPVGTCKMAPRDANGVVDERLRVYGVDNLRVADASVIPFSMAGHTSAPSTMIGERCAEFIKDEHTF